jgi:hypothetical protein
MRKARESCNNDSSADGSITGWLYMNRVPENGVGIEE